MVLGGIASPSLPSAQTSLCAAWSALLAPQEPPHQSVPKMLAWGDLILHRLVKVRIGWLFGHWQGFTSLFHYAKCGSVSDFPKRYIDKGSISHDGESVIIFCRMIDMVQLGQVMWK
jgi:hypothetical protein